MKDTTQLLANKLATQFEIEGNTLKLNEGAYESTLPEEITAEQASAVHAHDKAYIPAFTLAAGEIGIDVLAKNNAYAHVTSETIVGNSTVSVKVERSAAVNIPPKNAGEQATTRDVAGYTTARINTKVGTELKHVRDAISEQAKKAL
jgi:hypothetical protein